MSSSHSSCVRFLLVKYTFDIGRLQNSATNIGWPIHWRRGPCRSAIKPGNLDEWSVYYYIFLSPNKEAITNNLLRGSFLSRWAQIQLSPGRHYRPVRAPYPTAIWERRRGRKALGPKDKEPRRRRRRTTSIIQMPCYRRCKQNGRAEEGEVCNPIRLPSVTKSKGKGGEEMKLLDATERRYERRRGNYTPDRRNRIVSRIWTTEGKREDSVRRYVPHNKAVGSWGWLNLLRSCCHFKMPQNNKTFGHYSLHGRTNWRVVYDMLLAHHIASLFSLGVPVLD